MPSAVRPARRNRAHHAAPLRRLPLASLRVFVAAAEALSFARAAQVLGVTGSAVSMQIRALEEYLRAPLFRRQGRLVYLTEEGSRLLPRVRAALAELERAIDEARQERHAGPLTVSMLASFLQEWLLPRLPDFHRRHADIDLRIHTSNESVDFLRSGVQAAVRFGLGSWPALHAEKLLDDWLLPVCTPALLERHGPVRDRAELSRYTLLNSVSEPWRAWIEGRAVEEEEWAPRGSSLDDSVSVVRAAAAGHGLALSRWSLCAAEIAAGRLAIASRRIIRARYAYYFVCPPAYLSVEKVTALRNWLLEQAAAAPTPPFLPSA
ncbi:MAG TPA: transcriptional regulator GcvA [Steroidobacteraceae bacterium]|nr:transcriptional regulator GcvA [Steroidobacteraceae bacterium]